MYIVIELCTHLSWLQMFLITNASNRMSIDYTNVSISRWVHLWHDIILT